MGSESAVHGLLGLLQQGVEVQRVILALDGTRTSFICAAETQSADVRASGTILGSFFPLGLVFVTVLAFMVQCVIFGPIWYYYIGKSLTHCPSIH